VVLTRFIDFTCTLLKFRVNSLSLKCTREYPRTLTSYWDRTDSPRFTAYHGPVHYPNLSKGMSQVVSKKNKNSGPQRAYSKSLIAASTFNHRESTWRLFVLGITSIDEKMPCYWQCFCSHVVTFDTSIIVFHWFRNILSWKYILLT